MYVIEEAMTSQKLHDVIAFSVMRIVVKGLPLNLLAEHCQDMKDPSI